VIAVAPERRWPRAARIVAIAAVFCCALGVRLLYAGPAIADLYGVAQDRYRIAHFYHEAAASLADGDDRVVFPRGLERDDTLVVGYPPGYFVFMAAIYAMTNDDMAAVLLVQCVADALACVLLLLLGEALVSSLVGTVAGALMALSPQFAALSVVLKPDTLTVVPVLLAALLVVRGARSGRLATWAWAGLALGVACWLRQNALLLGPALALAALWSPEWRRRLAPAALMLGVCAAVVAPLTIRNVALTGEPIPVTVGSGFALLSGLARDDYAGRYDLPRFATNVSIDEAVDRGLPPAFYFDEYDRLQDGHTRKLEVKHTVLSVFAVDGVARDRERTREALRLIRSDPRYFASIYWLRIERLLGYTQQNRPVPPEETRPTRASESLAFYTAVDPSGGRWRYYRERGRVWDVLRPPLAAAQRSFVTPVLLGLAALGLVVVLVRERRSLPVLLVIPLYYLGLQAVMWAEFRHTLPVHASVFVLIGVAVAAALDTCARLARWRKPKS
jgi:hypothetical protein